MPCTKASPVGQPEPIEPSKTRWRPNPGGAFKLEVSDELYDRVLAFASLADASILAVADHFVRKALAQADGEAVAARMLGP